jgi:uncharacterized protein
MFHLFVTTAYIIPNIYLYFRIMHLFIGKRYRFVYTIAYLLIISVYPLSQGFSGGIANVPAQIMSSFSDYLLPFLLYLFLFVLLYDLFLIINHMFRFISVEKRRSLSFRLRMMGAFLILSFMIVIAGAVNLNTIRISRYTLEVPRRSSEIDHLRVAFASDLHLQQNIRIQFIEQFVRKVNAAEPDLMLYGGDIIEGDDEEETTLAIESAIKGIQTKYGIYGVTGNHEFYGGNYQSSFFEKSGITMLYDTVIRVDSLFYLAGRNDRQMRQRKSIVELFAGIPHDMPVILVDHRPVELQEVSHTIADVQLSGHTHNGQLFPINLIIHSMYELSRGYRKIGNTHFFVTTGVRLWGPPVRTTGRSEVMIIDMIFL